MDLVIFGIGKFFLNREQDINGEDRIVAYLDNDAKKSQEHNGIPVLLPTNITNLKYDYVLIMSTYRDDMTKQLTSLGVTRYKIINWEEYVSFTRKNIVVLNKGVETDRRKILIISDPLLYNGGAVSVFNAGIVLMKMGYSVTIASYQIDERMAQELKKYGISVLLIEQLLPITAREVKKLEGYDIVLVNVFPMLNVACTFSELLPTVWWIHESKQYYSFYEDTLRWYSKYNDINLIKNIHIIAVSKIAQNNIESYFRNVVRGVVPIGIFDSGNTCTNALNKEKIVVGIIGAVMPPKGQLVLINAIRRLNGQVECKIIGQIYDQEYYDNIKEIATDKIEIMGVLTRKEIDEQYKGMDVVICASLEETLSMTIIEGMMNSKICITTDNTGIAEYIEDGVNGFICKAGDVESLREKMQYVIDHFDELDDMRKKARQTYEKYFTLEVLGENLEREINIAVEEFNKKRG